MFAVSLTIFIGISSDPVNILGYSPADVYFFKGKHGNTRAMFKICSKLTINKPERRHLSCCDVFIVDFEQISHISWRFHC